MQLPSEMASCSCNSHHKSSSQSLVTALSAKLIEQCGLCIQRKANVSNVLRTYSLNPFRLLGLMLEILRQSHPSRVQNLGRLRKYEPAVRLRYPCRRCICGLPLCHSIRLTVCQRLIFAWWTIFCEKVLLAAFPQVRVPLSSSALSEKVKRRGEGRLLSEGKSSIFLTCRSQCVTCFRDRNLLLSSCSSPI